MARLAEELGFDSGWTIDHFLLKYPTGPSVGLWECWTLTAALAAATQRMELGTLVTCVSFRNPALLAKMADTVDEISGGRLILGLGAGWVPDEYAMLGLPFDHSATRFEEAIQIIHQLLREGHVDFEGRFHQARDCELRPRGPRPQGPPIMIGTTGERMLRLTARYADSWNVFFSSFGNNLDEFRPLMARVDAACQAEGRDPATLERSATVMVGFVLPGAVGHPGAKQPIAGTPQQIAEQLRGFEQAGVGHLQVYLDPQTPRGVEAFAPVLELVRGGR